MSDTPRRRLLQGALSSTAPLLLSAALCFMSSAESLAATSSSKKQQYDLKAQPLVDAVVAWAAESGFELRWLTDIPEQLNAPEVSGNLSPEEALTRLLAHTDLTYELLGAQKVAIGLKPKAREGHEKAKREDPRKDGGISSGPPQGLSTQSSKRTAAEVVVTGTHIRGVPPAGSPVIVFDEKEIHSGRYTTLQDVLETLPQNIRSGAGGESADARLSAGSGATTNMTYAAGPNLRGLESTATLTLINGHRVAPSGQGYMVDVSQIPIAAISRIEVLMDGASAVYGADAIAGVVNVFLKEDFDGTKTHVRYGFTEPSGREEMAVSHTFGTDWKTGSFLAIGSHLEQTQLSVNERRWTQGVLQPESIFPSNRQLSVHMAGHQRFADQWTLRADAQHGHTHRLAQSTATPGPGRLTFPVVIDRTNASVGLHHKGSSGWEFAVRGHLSTEEAGFSFLHFSPGSNTPEMSRSQVQKLSQDQWITSVAANGVLGSTFAGDIRLALGAEHREEAYMRRLRSPMSGREDISRNVDSSFIEMHVPVISDLNRIPGVNALNLSLAGRYDDYSDFGDSFNPKFGVTWTPIPGIDIRSTFSQSFRTPGMGAELITTSAGTDALVPLYSFETSDGSNPVAGAVLTGSKNLRPEKSRDWTAGFTLRPTMLEGWKLDVTYYSILYTGRIVGPPLDLKGLFNPALQSFIKHYGSAAELQAALESETAGNLVFLDRTGPDHAGGAFGANPQDFATYVFDARLANASTVDTSGWDIGLAYEGRMRGGDLTFSLTANQINAIRTVYAPGAPVVDTVGTIGNPAGLTLSAGGTYTHGGWHGAVSVNHTRGYRDTALNMRVASYLTADALLSYTFASDRTDVLGGVSVRFGVTNMTNEAPPHIVGSRATRGANYDVANADPLGRMVTFEIYKRW